MVNRRLWFESLLLPALSWIDARSRIQCVVRQGRFSSYSFRGQGQWVRIGGIELEIGDESEMEVSLARGSSRTHQKGDNPTHSITHEQILFFRALSIQ